MSRKRKGREIDRESEYWEAVVRVRKEGSENGRRDGGYVGGRGSD